MCSLPPKMEPQIQSLHPHPQNPQKPKTEMSSFLPKMEPQIQSLHPHPQNPINPNPHFNTDTFQNHKQKQFMEELRDAVINLATSHSSRPLTTERKTHIEQRLHQLFPVFHTPSHPAYAAMIHCAIEELNEEGGSSEESISGFIKANYDDLPWAHASLLNHHLGKLTAKKEIVVTDSKCYTLPVENPNPEKRRQNQELPIENPSHENRRRKQKLLIENPNPEKRRRKRKLGGEQERSGGQNRRSGENVIEEESQSHERDSEVNGEKIRRTGGGVEVIEEQTPLDGEQIEMIEEPNQSHEQQGEIEAFDEQNRSIGRQCELIEKQIGARGARSEVIGEHNQVEEQRIEEKDQLQEQQSEVSEEQNQIEEEKIELFEEGNQVKELQSEVIGEENEPQEQDSEVRTELLRSCRDRDALMVPLGESPRPLESPCGERVVEVIEEQICLQEKEHRAIEQQFQPNEQQAEESSKILPLGHGGDGDALMILSGGHVVEEEKNESLKEKEEEQEQTESGPCGEREFDVEVIEEQRREQEVTKEHWQLNEQQVEVRGEILPSCHGGDCNGEDLVVRFGESQMLVVEEEKNEYLAEEQQQHQTESPLERREFFVEVVEEQSQALKQENEATGELKQQNEVIEEQFQPQEEQIEVKTQILRSCQDGKGGHCDGNDLRVQHTATAKPIMKGKKKRLLEEGKHEETKVPCEGMEIAVICSLSVQQWQQKSKSNRQKFINEEASQTTEKQAKRRGRKIKSTSQPTTMTTSLDLPLTSRQREPEQQQEFPNQERPLELKRMRVEEISETRQQEPQEKLQQRILRFRVRGPLKTEPTTATTMEGLLPSQHEQQQPRRRGRGRPPKPKSDADTNHQHHDEQQQPQRRRRGRPRKSKPDAETTIENSLAQQKKPKCRRLGRSPKSNSDADTTIRDILNSKNQLKKPKRRGRGRPPKPKSDADTTMGGLVDLTEPTAVTKALRLRKASETRLRADGIQGR